MGELFGQGQSQRISSVFFSFFFNRSFQTGSYALDAHKAELWKRSYDGVRDASVTVATGGLIIAGTSSGKVIGAQPSGEQIWGAQLDGRLTPAALGQQGTLYVGSSNGRLYAIKTGLGSPASTWSQTFADAQRTASAPYNAAVPGIPSNIHATKGTLPNRVAISWESAANALHYEIWSGTTVDRSTAHLLGTAPPGTTQYFDGKPVGDAAVYYYWLRATNAIGSSAFSESVSGSAAVNGAQGSWVLLSGGPIRRSSPAIGADRTVYIQTSGELGPTGVPVNAGALLAVDKEGTQLWQVSTGEYGDSSPALGPDGTIYVGTGYYSYLSSGTQGVKGHLIACNPDGGVKWRFATTDPIVSAPAIGPDGTVYFGCQDYRIYAIGPDGNKKWDFPTGSPIFSALAIAADGTIYSGSTDRNLYALNPDGTLKWEFTAAGYVNSPIVAADGTVYFGTSGDTVNWLYSLNPDGRVRWYYQAGGSVSGAPAIGRNGNIYFGTSDGRLLSLTRSGDKQWEFIAGGAITSTPAVTADESIYVTSLDGKLNRVNADGTLNSDLAPGGPISSSPAIDSYGRIYFGTDGGSLYALNGGIGPDSNKWGMFGRTATHTFADAGRKFPNEPTNLRASEGDGTKISLVWDGPSGEVTYEVWRATTAAEETAAKVGEFLQDASFDDLSAPAGVTFYYWVRAKNSRGTGPSSQSVAASRPLPPTGGIVWKYLIGDSAQYTAPAIGPDGTIYVGGTELHALTPTGMVKWTTPVEGVLVGTPAIGADGTVYGGTTSYRLYAIAADGTVKWAVRGEADFGAFLTSAAIGADGTIYIGGNETRFYATNPDGAFKWVYRVAPDYATGPVDSSAAIASDGTIYVSAIDRLHALRPSGDLQWIHEPGGSYAPTIGPLSEIYIANDDATLQCVHPDGTRKWLFRTDGAAGGSAPVVGPDGTIYCGTSAGSLFAITANGDLKWKFSAAGPIRASASLAADGTICFGSTDGFFYALDANGNLQWKTQAGGPIESPPAIGDNGTIYFVSKDGSLYFIRGQAPLAQSAWPTFRQNDRRTGLSPVPTRPVARPTNLRASNGTFPGVVRLEWDSADAAVSYDAVRSTNPDFSNAVQVATNLSGILLYDKSAALEQRYFYWVRARNAQGTSDWSGPISGYQDFPNPIEDNQWSTEFYAPGQLNPSNSGRLTFALAFTANGNLIAGGGFSQIAGLPGTAGIAQWDGAEWSQIGGGINVGGTVYSLLTTNNEIYIGGQFNSVGGQSMANIAHWDGNAWHPMGDGLSGGAVRSLALWNGRLFAGGAFTQAGSLPIKYLAQWDGSSWADLGTPISSSSGARGAFPPVGVLKIFAGSLFVGGSFTLPGPAPATNVARWDGSNWHQAGRVPQTVTALEEFSGTLVAGLSDAPSGGASLVIKWNGNEWEPLGQLTRPSVGLIQFLYSDSTFLYAGGRFISADGLQVGGFARWNGSSWEVPPGSFAERSAAMNGRGSQLYVSTFISSVMAGGVNGILRFDGERWSALGGGIVQENAVIHDIVPMAGGVMVGGTFDGQTAALWSEGRWEAKSPAQSVNGFTRNNDTIYAAGSTALGGAVDVFDGTNWTRMGDVFPDSGLCVGIRGLELFAGHVQGIARWDGQRWTNLGEGLSGAVRAIKFLGKDLYAGGFFTNSGGKQIDYLARWDGNQWWPLGGGVNGRVFDLATFGSTLYAAGQFDAADGVPVRSLAIWDGTRWSRPSIELLDPSQGIFCLEVAPDGSLYAGGDMRPFGDPVPLYIARWDGVRWTSLGSGVNSTPSALRLSGNDLYVAGNFNVAGNRSSVRFGRWHIPELLLPSVIAPQSAPIGSVVQYQISVRNPGNVDYQACFLRAGIPPGTEVVASSGGVGGNDLVTWPLGDIRAGQQATRTLSLKATGTEPFIQFGDYSVSDNAGKVYRGSPSFTSLLPGQKLAQTISFALPIALFGTNLLPLKATASSGLPVSFEIVSGPARIVDDRLIPSGTGVVTIRATQAGDERYESASPTESILTVYELPHLTVEASGEKLVLKWPGQYEGFTLQTAVSIEGPWENTTSQRLGEELISLIDFAGRHRFFRLLKEP